MPNKVGASNPTSVAYVWSKKCHDWAPALRLVVALIQRC